MVEGEADTSGVREEERGVARRHLCKAEEDDARVFRDSLVVQQSRAEGVGRDVCV